MRNADDLTLVARIAEGDAQALGALYDSRGALVYRLALRVVADSGDAEEVVQDAFVRVWENAPRFRGGSVKGWLVRIALNLSRDRLRRRRRRRVVLTANPQGEAALEADNRGGEVDRALRRLPPGERAALTLHYYEGMTFTAAAAVLGVSLRTAKYRAARGLARLRRILDEHS